MDYCVFFTILIFYFWGCVSGEWPAAVRRPTTQLGRPTTGERQRDLCGETTKRSVWRRTGPTVWEGKSLLLDSEWSQHFCYYSIISCSHKFSHQFGFLSSSLQFGKIYEVRMMMDFNGNNRGYAFVTFSTKQEAKAAMKQLNNYEIRSDNTTTITTQYSRAISRAAVILYLWF